MTQDIDRKTASRLLKVAVRTIDRYVRRGKLGARAAHGRIWLNKKEVIELSRALRSHTPQSMDSPHATPSVYSYRTPPAAKALQEDFYKDLYEEARRVLLEYQQKLEQAHYRIGQLESQTLHSSPPMRQQSDVSAVRREPDIKDMYAKEVLLLERELSVLKEIAKKERVAHIVFALMTYVLLVLLPIMWYLLR